MHCYSNNLSIVFTGGVTLSLTVMVGLLQLSNTSALLLYLMHTSMVLKTILLWGNLHYQFIVSILSLN